MERVGRRKLCYVDHCVYYWNTAVIKTTEWVMQSIWEKNIDDYIKYWWKPNGTKVLRKQCVQLGKPVKDFKLEMYILKNMGQEFV